MTSPTPAPRSTRSLARASLAFALAVAVGISGAAAAFAASPGASGSERPAPVVVILLAPFLTLSDLSPATTPALWSLAETGAVGSMNAITADPGWPTVAGGALTLSAGRWAAAAATGPADAASLGRQRSANDRSLAPPILGTLGDAVRAAGGLTAAVGSSDPGSGPEVTPARPAELVATDSRGGIDFVATDSGDVLVDDVTAPFGVRTDPTLLRSAIASALAAIDLGRGPGLLVVDSGDLARAHAAASQRGADESRLTPGHADAVASLDAAASAVIGALPENALVLVVTPTTDKQYYQPPSFGPVIASGGGLSGALTSASTHRDGLVTNLDVAPTVLDALGIELPTNMIGMPVSARADATPLAERIADLDRTGSAVGAIDKLRDLYFTPAFAWFAVACVGIAVLAAFRRIRALRGTGRVLLLMVLSVPAAAWVALLVARSPSSPRDAAVALGVAWLAVFGVALAVRWRAGSPKALAGLAGTTALLILVDQWFGGPLQSGLFSYSVRAGWRYYGIGNEGSALAVGAALAGVGLMCDLAVGTRWAPSLRRYAIPVVGAIVLVTAAAPFAGANAGVAVWGAIAFAVAWLRMNRIPLTARTVAWTGAVVVLLVGALAAVDLLGIGGGTHIGRFFLQLVRDGSGAAALVRRKALNNLGYVTQTPYSWLALAIALALGLERLVRPRPLAAALSGFPAYAGALVGVVIGSVVALVTEDSGVVMPALMLLTGALPALYLALREPPASAGDSIPTSEENHV